MRTVISALPRPSITPGRAVAAGEEIVIAKAGKPVARLLPFEPRREPRQPGLIKGKIWIADDFDDPLPEEIMAAFRGERP